MNKQCYRIVFNKARGSLMVVAENVVSQGKSPGMTSGHAVAAPTAGRQALLGAVHPLAFSIGAILGMVMWSNGARAQIVADPGAPGSQRPTVVTTANNIPLVNIQTPSAAGVSHNTYKQFDVQQQGAVLNNSRTNVQTQLGGWVQGNPWLANGSARVILNEVNSSNPSYLRGYAEVAGAKAQVVIANPSGVTCDGCGFINANRATLTTGTPIVAGGDLTGYRVQGGTIAITGSGMDASTADYADLIARSIQVNAGIWAGQLKLTAGATQVDAANMQATPIEGTGAAPAFAIDVAQLGGMYAGKIMMVGTEAGVGMRNLGQIGAAAGDVIVNANGRLENAGRMTSAGNTQISAENGIRNSGTLYAQADAALSTRGNINNSSIIAAKGNAALTANGSTSNLISTQNGVLGAGIQTDGSLGSSGSLTVNATQTLIAQGQNISGGDQLMAAQAINIAGSRTSADNLTLKASAGDIAAMGTNVSAARTLNAHAAQALRTDHAQLAADQISIDAQDVSNVQGQLLQIGTGDFSLKLPGRLDNTQGRIAVNSRNADISAATVFNAEGSLEHAGAGTFSLSAQTLSDTHGQIGSNGKLDIAAATATLDAATTIASTLRINADVLSNRGGSLLQTGSDAGSISAAVQFDNTGGQLLSNGSTALTVGDLINDGGTIQASGTSPSDLAIHATGNVSNRAQAGTAGRINATGAIDAAAKQIDNTGGQIAAGESLSLNITNAAANQQGTIAASQDVSLHAGSVDNTQGKIGSVQGRADINASHGALTNTSGHIEAAGALTASSKGMHNAGGTAAGNSIALNSGRQTLDNSGGIIVSTGGSGGAITIQSGSLNNNAGLISAQGALSMDTHGQKLANTNSGAGGGIVAQGTATLTTGELDNRSGYIGSNGALAIAGSNIDNAQGGLIAGASSLDLASTALNNQDGQIQILGNANIIATGNIDNAGGLLRSGETLNVNADAVDNSNTQGSGQGMEGGSVAVAANQIGNQSGAIRANVSATLTSDGSINNTQGLVSATNTVTLKDSQSSNKTLAVTNSAGTLIAGQSLGIDSKSLSGDGSLLSQGDLNVKLDDGYTHTGLLQANGTASLQTAGTLTNSATMEAGTALNLKAGTIDNQASGQLKSNAISLQATDSHTLTNRGLINASDTFIDTITLHNLGTGRIYGDHVAINAATLTNGAENGTAPVIAARSRLDIGAITITNNEHALIFSAGDLAVGGSLDAGKQAVGRAGMINNDSAALEALGNVDIAADQINNNNLRLTTMDAVTGNDSIAEYQGAGSPYRYAAGTPGVYTYVDESLHLHTPEGNYESWTLYNYNRTTVETKVQSSDPGKIQSGGTLHIAADTLNNNNSQIIAGGNLNGNIAHLNNQSTAGQRIITDSGSVTSYWRDHKKGTDDTGVSSTGYQPAPVIQAISLNAMTYQGNTSAGISGTQIANLAVGNVGQSASGAPAAAVNVHPGASVTPITQVAALNANGAHTQNTVVRTGGLNISVPNNSLYSTQPQPGARYLVATDPAFADYRAWLSSDYMLNALAVDPAMTQTRLGDGFYEQRLMQEQVAQLTGRRFLEGYTDNTVEYQALMNNGVTFARQQQLSPGIALTAAQMAALTSDIVWLVEKEVALPDGRTTRALVPQLYVRVQDGDLQSSGALLAGNNVNLNVTNDLVNSGTIAGRQVVSLTADKLQNLGGRITGNDLAVAARTDLDNIGGTIDAVNSLTAVAGRDFNTVSTLSTQTGAQGSTTNINRVAGLYITGSGGTLVAAAGHDLNLLAAAVTNGRQASGAADSTVLTAGNNINLGTVTESSSHQLAWDGKNRRQDSTSTEAGTSLQAQGDLHLQAGNDINARGANMTSSQGAIQLQAARDVNLTAAETHQTVDEAHEHKGKSGMFSSKTIATRDTVDQTLAQGTTVSGNTIVIQANHDINLTGSNAVSTAGMALAAQHDIKVQAAVNTTVESHLHNEKTSGLFSGGGIGVTFGTQEQSTGQQATHTAASASTVGSTQGNVAIAAGNHYAQTGSDVLAPQGNIDIAAKKIDITEARNTNDRTIETRFKQSGLTLALTSPVISAIQTADQMRKAAGQTSDTRMKALAAATTVLSGADAYNAVKAGQGTTINGTPDQIATGKDANGNPTSRTANAADQAGGINLSISIGASQSKSDTRQSSSTAAGSTVAAGKDVSIRATGDAGNSNLTIQGSTIKAGNNLTLQADNQINLLAAQNTDEQHSTNSSASGSIGISIGTGGFGVTASASMGRGHADGSDAAWTNTHVEAGKQLTLQSGGGTTLSGATAKGDRVVAQVGGNLAIESLQDTSVYDSRQQSIGGSITVGAGVSGSINFSDSKANSHYASVTEQSGIKAGDGGFHVDVAGNTDLKGGVIASSEHAAQGGKNSLTTGTLTTSDILNHADADASTSGIGLSSDMLSQGKYGAAKAIGSALINNGSRSETSSGATRSAVSIGAVTITNGTAQQARTGQSAEQAVASLNSDVGNAQSAVQKQDVQAMQATLQAEQQIKQAVYNQAVKFTDEAYRTTFVKNHPMYVVTGDKNGKTHLRPLSEQEKYALQAGPDGKINIAANGIFNTPEAAAKYALQHQAGTGPQYLIYFPEAENAISELLIAGYQKFLENNFWGLSNSAQQAQGMMNRYGESGLHLDGHSRGSMTIGNAMESLSTQSNSQQGILSATTINFFGPAYNAAHADELLGNLQNRDAIADPSAKNRMVLQLENHAYDPVGRLIGGNPATGGTVPEGSSGVVEAIRAATGQNNTTHNCYGASASDECTNFWQSSDIKRSVLRPIKTYP